MGGGRREELEGGFERVGSSVSGLNPRVTISDEEDAPG